MSPSQEHAAAAFSSPQQGFKAGSCHSSVLSGVGTGGPRGKYGKFHTWQFSKPELSGETQV